MSMIEKNTVQTRNYTPAERFTAAVVRQYAADVGQVELTEYERTLLQHCFIKCDMAFADARSKQKDDQLPIEWANVNMKKLALDAAHRIKLGIDGLVPGHLYPIAYYNKASKLYDIDLRIGYKGEIYYVMNSSMRPIHDIRVELVYSNDEFVVYKKGTTCKIEGYDLKVTNPFDRGEVVGGFAYIEYEDEQDNTLMVMSKAKFDERRRLSGSDKFWGPYYDEMCYKTLVHAAAKKITIDPRKINVDALNAVEIDEETTLHDDEQPSTPARGEIILDADEDDLEETPQQPLLQQENLAPEGFTVNQAAPARETAKSYRQAPPPASTAQQAYEPRELTFQQRQAAAPRYEQPGGQGSFLQDVKARTARKDPF